MSHSSRNTSRAFFTNYERDQLKGRWGAQKARLTRESFLPLAACHLCLQTAREPVACRDGGHIFCKECAVTNLLSQKKEIARLEKEADRQQSETDEVAKEKVEEAQDEEIKDFERTMNGLESEAGARPLKRKLDPETDDTRGASRQKLDDGKVESTIQVYGNANRDQKSSQPFWMPSSTDALETTKLESSTKRKRNPICPSASSKNSHPLSLKALVPVKFTTSSTISSDSNSATIEVNGRAAAIICPACKKGLSSSSKIILTIPCGHVICKTCTDQFMTSKTAPSAGKHSISVAEDIPLGCYVCQTNLTPSKDKKFKDKLKPGLLELATQGTGFTGAGQAVIDKEGIAFHFG